MKILPSPISPATPDRPPLLNRLDGWLNEFIINSYLKLYLAQEIDRNFMTTVSLRVTKLPAEALGHRESSNERPQLLTRLV
jgi:hypothetical protein